MGATVLFLRSSSHAVSLADKEPASLIVGRFKGQSTAAGAYPPEGESGKARFSAANGGARAAAAAANVSGELS
jgi:hypothetical protein